MTYKFNRAVLTNGVRMGMSLLDLKDRGTGRSTALALSYLGLAINAPGKPVTVRDHANTPAADRHLCRRIKDIAARIDLERIEVNFEQRTVLSKFAEVLE